MLCAESHPSLLAKLQDADFFPGMTDSSLGEMSTDNVLAKCSNFAMSTETQLQRLLSIVQGMYLYSTHTHFYDLCVLCLYFLSHRTLFSWSFLHIDANILGNTRS